MRKWHKLLFDNFIYSAFYEHELFSLQLFAEDKLK